MMGYIKETQELTERVSNGQRRNNLSNKINEVPVDYNEKYKINIHETRLI